MTGVQTCALPISFRSPPQRAPEGSALWTPGPARTAPEGSALWTPTPLRGSFAAAGRGLGCAAYCGCSAGLPARTTAGRPDSCGRLFFMVMKRHKRYRFIMILPISFYAISGVFSSYFLLFKGSFLDILWLASTAFLFLEKIAEILCLSGSFMCAVLLYMLPHL